MREFYLFIEEPKIYLSGIYYDLKRELNDINIEIHNLVSKHDLLTDHIIIRTEHYTNISLKKILNKYMTIIGYNGKYIILQS